jgi:KipI family sensor histidine kinase inhibitor
MPDARLVAAGDALMLLELENMIDPDVNARAIAIASTIEALRIPGVTDVVPTYRSVGVYFDPLRTRHEQLVDALERCARDETPAPRETRVIEVPVVYGGDAGPDLADVAAHAGIPETEVIERHSRVVYRVYMLGFVPGFAYMGVVDERLRIPRRPTPRLRVPAQSVAIAAFQTGIYPADTPGGWWILGRSVLAPFDPARAEPFLFRAGDSVRFVPVNSRDERTDRRSKSHD